MVDSGAKKSTVAVELVQGRSAFQMRPLSRSWMTIDKKPIDAVGEVSLIIRWRGITTELPVVLVVRNPVRPLVLGTEWILWSGSHVHPQDGVLICSVYRPMHAGKPASSPVVSLPEVAEIPSSSENVSDKTSVVVEVGEEVTDDLSTEEEIESANGVGESCLQLFGDMRIHPKSLSYVRATVPESNDGTWLVPSVASENSDHAWVVPNCVLKAELDGTV